MGEIASSLIDGPFGSNLKSEHYQSSGVRVVRLQNIADGRFDDRDKAYISLDHFKTLNRHEARPGDVLVERSQEAVMLVIGRRDSSSRTTLGGSLSAFCLAYAACPVTVVTSATKPAHLDIEKELSGSAVHQPTQWKGTEQCNR